MRKRGRLGDLVMLFEFDSDMIDDDDNDEIFKRSGMIAIFENDDGRVCFTFFTSEQWEMIQDVSSVSDVPMEETLLNVIKDMNTVVFLDPDDS